MQLEGFDEEQSGEETAWNEWMEGAETHACETCDGQRLNQVALHVRFRDCNIADLTHSGHRRHRGLREQAAAHKREAEIARDLMAEIKARIAFLQRVGLGYLPLDRPRPRCRAAKRSASGSRPSSAPTCRACATYWTSPPSACIPRDNRVLLLDALAELAKHRNTLVVVEHDEDTIRRARSTSSTWVRAQACAAVEVVGYRQRRGPKEEPGLR
jgi:excinuclease ABC subunit A